MKVTVEVRQEPFDLFSFATSEKLRRRARSLNFYIYRLSDGGVAKGPFMTPGEAFEWIRRWNRKHRHKKIYSLKI